MQTEPRQQIRNIFPRLDARQRKGQTGKSVLRWRLFVVVSVALLAIIATAIGFAQGLPQTSPSSGTLSPLNPVITFNGGPFPVSNPSNPIGQNPPVCTDATCGVFTLTVDIPANDSTVYAVDVSVSWTDSGTTTQLNSESDYDVTVYDPDFTGNELANSGANSNPEEAIFKAVNGTYTVYVVPYDVSPTVPFSGKITLTPVSPEPAPTPVPLPSPGVPRFSNYMSPPSVANGWGEPSIGVNWNTGNVMFFGGLSQYAVRVNFDDSTSPARTTWDRTPLTMDTLRRAVGGDPILYTDRETGRTLVSQLQFGTTTATLDYTDNDGANYSPSQGAGIASGIDHQTVGGGHYHAPLPQGVVYKNAVYYCAQDDVDAGCALSVDGGRTFGPAVVTYTTECGGIHGHVKVAPDGTVYLPNRNCGTNQQGAAVSEDNGITWTVRVVPDATNGDTDPSVGMGADGTVYFGYEGADGHARIASSRDKGQTWTPSQDVGALLGLQNSVFPAVVAGDGGDNGRAAFAFFGSLTPGNYDNDLFMGNWYLFVASTFDGGKTWKTVNATPNDPVQRGRVCTAGINCSGNSRNLLDFFDATIDKEGRILVGYDDGCITSECIQGDKNHDGMIDGRDNDFTSKGVIARQSGGRRMFAQFDPVEPTTPAAPALNATLVTGNPVVHLSWLAPDSGASRITAYRIYRRTAGSAFAQIASVLETAFDDRTAAANTTYLYRVSAVNAIGEGPFSAEVQPVITSGPTACETPGVLVLSDVNNDGSDFDIQPNIPPDAHVNIRKLFVAEPYLGPGVNKLVFTLQMAPADQSIPTPNSQWYVIWNRLHPDAQYDRMYVAMKTDATGAPSFEYGKFGVALPIPSVPTGTNNSPFKLGDVDSGSYDPASGLIVFTLSDAKAENIQAGQSLVALNARTFLNQPDTFRSQTVANDITDDTIYKLIGNGTCKLNSPPTAGLDGTPHQGVAPLAVSFDASGSTDPDGDPLSFTFDFGDGTPTVTQSNPRIAHTYQSAGNYFATVTATDPQGAVSTNAPQVAIQVSAKPTVETIEDDDSRIAYSEGWHLVNNSAASAGHFRYHTGKNSSHLATLDINVPAGKTGSLSYYFARSPKGGTADVYLDGVLKETINFKGSNGSTQAPEFSANYKVSYGSLAAGAHRLQIKNMSDVVYVDRFVLESASSTATPSSGPGSTSNKQSSVGGSQSASSGYQPPSGSKSFTVTAESSLNLPFQLALVSPSGLALATVSSSNGIATINQPVTQGSSYVVKVINLNLGPLQLTTTIKPTVSR